MNSVEIITEANKWSCYALIYSSIIVLFVLTRVNAPYGRYTKSKGWGILIPSQIAWTIMESPNILVSMIIIFSANKISLNNQFHSAKPLPNKILMSMFLLHYINRVIIYPLQIKSGHQMPFAVVLSAFTFCTWNALNQASYLLIIHDYDISWLQNWKFIIGTSIFFIGMFINISSDRTLLRIRGSTHSNDLKYKIPRGGMFNYVSCANYFGEILEWFGFAIACWSLPAWAFFISTFCNLTPRALVHHAWYKQMFENYPKNRKSIIPFII